ncbi:hypothetical protein KEF85_01525 [Methylomonas paludis]|uniref:Uncharacterized protein n=1 Tax=Methylomonas paludis TaxID=1173101 RepID=A0A975MP46_9GAMM|nr:hypothetical protein [Methylomonas paludis]QWF71204.1 hypothetical protein KEF85_01525 [Methylomonas paludis]
MRITSAREGWYALKVSQKELDSFKRSDIMTLKKYHIVGWQVHETEIKPITPIGVFESSYVCIAPNGRVYSSKTVFSNLACWWNYVLTDRKVRLKRMDIKLLHDISRGV